MSQIAHYSVPTGRKKVSAKKMAHLPQLRMSKNDERIMLQLYVPLNEAMGTEVVLRTRSSARLGVRSGRMFAVIQEMIVWIECHLGSSLCVQDISRKSGYSTWHLQRTFNQMTGFSVYEFIRTRRVINVVYALIHSEKPLLDIAIENGFNCQVSFTRTIRTFTSYTPGYIRQNFSLNDQWLINALELLICK